MQDNDGSITCMAPFTFGASPTDPVCSAFLIAAWEACMHTGNKEVIAEGYEGFKTWNNYLESNLNRISYLVHGSVYKHRKPSDIKMSLSH